MLSAIPSSRAMREEDNASQRHGDDAFLRFAQRPGPRSPPTLRQALLHGGGNPCCPDSWPRPPRRQAPRAAPRPAVSCRGAPARPHPAKACDRYPYGRTSCPPRRNAIPSHVSNGIRLRHPIPESAMSRKQHIGPMHVETASMDGRGHVTAAPYVETDIVAAVEAPQQRLHVLDAQAVVYPAPRFAASSSACSYHAWHHLTPVNAATPTCMAPHDTATRLYAWIEVVPSLPPLVDHAAQQLLI